MANTTVLSTIQPMSLMENTTMLLMENTAMALMQNATLPLMENTTIFFENNETNTKQAAAISASPGLVYLSYITLPIFLVVGLSGNSMTIAVTLSKTYRASFHGILITAMAFTDITYMLAVPFSKPFVQKLFGVDVRVLSPAGCSIFYTFYRAGKIGSAALVCLICLERFLLTRFPIKARTMVNMRAAVISVSVSFVAIATFCGLWSTLADVKGTKCIGVALTPENKQTAKVYSIIGMALHSFIPTTLLLSFTPPTIFTICNQRTARRRVQSSKTSKDSGPDEAYHATLMLLGIIFAYLLLVTPFCLSRHILVLEGINIAAYPELWAKNLDAVAAICEEANCAINFFLYCLLSPSFRTQLLALFRGSAAVASTSSKSTSGQTN